jgi:hypothetical protein
MSKVISYKLYVLSFPEKVAELIWLSQILVLILYTITTKPTEDAVYDKYKYLLQSPLFNPLPSFAIF